VLGGGASTFTHVLPTRSRARGVLPRRLPEVGAHVVRWILARRLMPTPHKSDAQHRNHHVPHQHQPQGTVTTGRLPDGEWLRAFPRARKDGPRGPTLRLEPIGAFGMGHHPGADAGHEQHQRSLEPVQQFQGEGRAGGQEGQPMPCDRGQVANREAQVEPAPSRRKTYGASGCSFALTSTMGGNAPHRLNQ
jgi:hypothetical protein